MDNPQQQIKLNASWLKPLADEFQKPYMVQLKDFLKLEIQNKKTIYPPGPLYFSALDRTPFEKVKVVILGQDPYHGPGQAHGLCFSVPQGVPIPPSLQNIFKELKRDFGFQNPNHGNLESWADQGVLLLNATLTVQAGVAGSHQKKGWELFTDKIVHLINEHHHGVVFLLWGAYAQKKGEFIDRKKHLVLTAPHPSPLSAHRGFIGCGHFRQANEFLVKNNKEPINWELVNRNEDNSKNH